MTLGNYRFQEETANGDYKGLAVPRHCFLVGTDIQCIAKVGYEGGGQGLLSHIVNKHHTAPPPCTPTFNGQLTVI